MPTVGDAMRAELPAIGKGILPEVYTSHGILYHADCSALFAAIRDSSVDTVFADPPFNLGKDYGNGAHHDARSKLEYMDWTRSWVDEAIRVLKPGGSLFIYILPRWGYHIAAHLESQSMLFRHWIALSMKGTFPRGKRLYPAHYALLYFTKGEPKTFNKVRLPIPTCRHCGKEIKDYGGHRKYLNPAGLNLTDMWEDTAPSRHKRDKTRPHINELKPLIPSRCIQISTEPGDVVLDPFGGGGSTFEAAELLHRLWIGSEIATCDPISERLQSRFPADFMQPPSLAVRLLVGAYPHAQDHTRASLQRSVGEGQPTRPRRPSRRTSPDTDRISASGSGGKGQQRRRRSTGTS